MRDIHQMLCSFVFYEPCLSRLEMSVVCTYVMCKNLRHHRQKQYNLNSIGIKNHINTMHFTYGRYTTHTYMHYIGIYSVKNNNMEEPSPCNYIKEFCLAKSGSDTGMTILTMDDYNVLHKMYMTILHYI